MTEPWSTQKRQEMAERVIEEAKLTAERLGATCCVVIAFFNDGDKWHSIDAGGAPVPLRDVYRKLVTAYEIADEIGDSGEVKIQ